MTNISCIFMYIKESIMR